MNTSQRRGPSRSHLDRRERSAPEASNLVYIHPQRRYTLLPPSLSALLADRTQQSGWCLEAFCGALRASNHRYDRHCSPVLSPPNAQGPRWGTCDSGSLAFAAEHAMWHMPTLMQSGMRRGGTRSYGAAANGVGSPAIRVAATCVAA